MTTGLIVVGVVLGYPASVVVAFGVWAARHGEPAWKCETADSFVATLLWPLYFPYLAAVWAGRGAYRAGLLLGRPGTRLPVARLLDRNRGE